MRLGDNSLILGHRLSEWCGHGPILEEDIANTNIALDLIGQARAFLGYAAEVEGKGRTEDDIAYLRDASGFRNCLLVEQDNGDFAATTVRQYLFSAFCFLQFEQLCASKDATIAAVAAKAVKEVAYHLRHSGEWVVRMGDGTAESHQRAQDALNELWPFTGDLFEMDEHQQVLAKEGIATDLTALKSKWDKMVSDLMNRATLMIPADAYMQKGSLEGRHTEHLGYLLAEMQFLPRAYPGTQW